jgi:hypothetical protein
VLLILLGIWGGLVPFIGPYFHYAYTPDKAWAYTTGRLWLEILPGLATALGGLIVLLSARRPVAMLGAFVAALGGAWFVVGNLVSSLWNGGIPEAGVPVGSSITRLAAEELGFFIGLGVVIVFFAALALGRCAVVGVKDAALAERDSALEDTFDEAAAPAPSSFAATSPAATSAGAPGGSLAPQQERYQSAGGTFHGAHDESPTVTGRFPPPAESGFPAEQGSYEPTAESFPSASGQFPPGGPATHS